MGILLLPMVRNDVALVMGDFSPFPKAQGRLGNSIISPSHTHFTYY